MIRSLVSLLFLFAFLSPPVLADPLASAWHFIQQQRLHTPQDLPFLEDADSLGLERLLLSIAGEEFEQSGDVREAASFTLPTGLPPWYPTLPPHLNTTTPDNECQADIQYMAQSLIMKIRNPNDTANNEFFRNALLPALDASGKPGAGLLRGHLSFSGFFKQCRAISFESTRKLHKMNFFRVFYDVSLRPKSTPGACRAFLSVDLCLPESCNSNELWNVLLRGKEMRTSSICTVAANNEGKFEAVAGTYIVGIIMAALVVISVVSGFFDFYIHPHLKEHEITKTMAYRMFHAFSMYTNVREIFTVGKTNKEGQIGPVHCIRFFSMCWVIIGHLMNIYVGMSTNPLDVADEFKQVTTGFLVNAYFSVDSFFFLSGLLLGFVFFKGVKRNRRQALSPMTWVMFYVHRILRLSPPYFFAILFYTFVFLNWIVDMPAFMWPPGYKDPDPCRQNWWINLLYLHNFIDYEHQCYLISWYLATDLQIYLFTPLILIPLVISPILGLSVAAAFFALSTGANVFETFHYYFPPSDLEFGQKDPRATDHTMGTYTEMMYNAPWIRCQIYIIGMLVGWFLQIKGNRMRINRGLNIILWILSISLMLAAVLGLYDWVNGTYMALGWRAAYSSLSKVAWGVGLSWLVISCFYGYGGVVNAFMSWNIFVPLGRLSYSAYLVHYFIVVYYIGMAWLPRTYFSFSEAVLSTLIPCIFVTYLTATLWTAVFEVPFAKIEMMLIGGLRLGRTPAAKAKEPEAEAVPADVEKAAGGGENAAKEEQAIVADNKKPASDGAQVAPSSEKVKQPGWS